MGDLVLKKTTTGQITLTPQDVAGNQTVTIPAATGTLSLANTSTSGGIFFGGATSGVLYQDASNLYWDDTNNRLGIGTNTPSGMFDVSDGTVIGEINPYTASSGCYIGTRSNHAVLFQVNASEKGRIDTSGNWLLGTSTSNSYARLLIDGNNIWINSGTANQQTNWTSFNYGLAFPDGSGNPANGPGAMISSTPVASYGANINFATRAAAGGSAATRMFIDSQGQIALGTSATTVRAINFAAAEYSFQSPSGTPYYWNLSDSSGNNGANQSLYIRGLTSAGAGQATLASFNVVATTSSFSGSISKGSGSFKIDHPLPSMTDTHHLVHSFIEGPQADLIYRGVVKLVDGEAIVNIDTAAGMTEGTFELLCRDVQCFTSNEDGWDSVRGKVSGNILTIESQDGSSTSSVSWMVIGERKDKHMLDTGWTDENGKVIVEPLKEEGAN